MLHTSYCDLVVLLVHGSFFIVELHASWPHQSHQSSLSRLVFAMLMYVSLSRKLLFLCCFMTFDPQGPEAS